MTASRFGAVEFTGGSRGTHHIGAVAGQSLFEPLLLLELAGVAADELDELAVVAGLDELGVLDELDESELELEELELSDDDVLVELDGLVLLELPRLSVL